MVGFYLFGVGYFFVLFWVWLVAFFFPLMFELLLKLFPQGEYKQNTNLMVKGVLRHVKDFLPICLSVFMKLISAI